MVQENGIKYGFVITVPELPRTIPTLWPTVQVRYETCVLQTPCSANTLPESSCAEVHKVSLLASTDCASLSLRSWAAVLDAACSPAAGVSAVSIQLITC